MKKLSIYVLAILLHCLLVYQKKFQTSQTAKDKLEMSLRQTTSSLAECEKKFGQKSGKITMPCRTKLSKAKATMESLTESCIQKASNGKLLDQMALSLLVKKAQPASNNL